MYTKLTWQVKNNYCVLAMAQTKLAAIQKSKLFFKTNEYIEVINTESQEVHFRYEGGKFYLLKDGKMEKLVKKKPASSLKKSKDPSTLEQEF